MHISYIDNFSLFIRIAFFVNKIKLNSLIGKYLQKKIIIIFYIFGLLFKTYILKFHKLYAWFMVKRLTEFQKKVIFQNATETPFQNEYWNNKEEGLYIDAVSRVPLFCSLHKYDSGSGWPSFTRTINPEEVIEVEDSSLREKRVEVRGKTANSHLGHVFEDGPRDEGGLRYCINSASLEFIPKYAIEKEGFGKFLKMFSKNEDIILAGGCFWGLEELLSGLQGVVSTRVGYCGGFTKNPTYDTVKKGDTGHAKSVEVLFNPLEVTFEDLLKFFFQIHDPTTENKQGNDVGSQYRSAIFYFTEAQKNVAENIILRANLSGVFPGEIKTEVSPAGVFYKAEGYHQNYLKKNKGGYSCHFIRPNWKF